MVEKWFALETAFYYLFSCVEVNYENTNAFKPMKSILYRCPGIITDREEKYALHSAEVYKCLEQNVVFIRQLPPKACRYIQNILLLKNALYLTAFSIGG